MQINASICRASGEKACQCKRPCKSNFRGYDGKGQPTEKLPRIHRALWAAALRQKRATSILSLGELYILRSIVLSDVSCAARIASSIGVMESCRVSFFVEG